MLALNMLVNVMVCTLFCILFIDLHPPFVQLSWAINIKEYQINCPIVSLAQSDIN